MVNSTCSNLWLGVTAVLAVISTAASAASPEAELLRLAPKESTFCLVVRDVRGITARVWDGPFAAAFRKSTLGKALAGAPELAKLEVFKQQVSQALHVEWSTIRDDVFGDVIVLSYQNGPPGKPEEERGLLLTWTRDPKLAATLVDRLNAVQKESGELRELRQIAYKGETYYERIKNKGTNEYFLQKGSILAFSSQESAIRRAIELDQELPSAERQVPSLARELEQLDGRGFATLWLNPRSFDAELASRIKAARGHEAAFLGTFAQCWKALDGVALNCRLGRNLELDLTLATRKAELPPAILRLAAGFNQPSDFWRAVPDDAILAVAGRLDLPALVEAIAAFMAPEARNTAIATAEKGLGPIFGKKNVQSLPAYFGPDFGVCLTPPRSPEVVLPDLFAAIRIQSNKDNRIEQSIKDALEVGMTLLRVNLNSKSDEPVRLESKTQDGVEVRYLVHEKLFPPGIRPAFGFKNGFLMLSSNPDRILNTDLSAAKTSEEPNRLAILSFRHLREYLKTRRDGIADAVAAHRSFPRHDALAQIDKILTAMELFDRVELLNSSKKPGEMRLTLKVQMMEPLVGK